MDIHYGRKRSGIRKQLTDKIEHWLESIEDDTVQQIARENVIVTGGAIASMLLGDKINDYDLYFRTKAATRAVAEYYVAKFNEAQKLKVATGVTPYTPEVREDTIANIQGIEEERVTIFLKSAGVAGESQKEYNYFEGMHPDQTAEFVTSLAEPEGENKPAYRPIFLSQNAITLSNKVQLVIRFFGEPDQIHSNYDFVHATCYWDHFKKTLELPAAALEALLSRTLVYRGSLYPVASVFRTKKFIERGWRITAGQQLKMMWQISQIDLTDFTVLQEQLTGVDAAYMWQLLDALKDVEPEKINAAYVATIIDRIFD